MNPCLKPKKKIKCSICPTKFIKFSSTQRCCSLACAIKQAEKDKKKRERKETKLKLDSIKSLSEHLKEAQTAFNRFIRERDKNELCISCQKIGKKRNAGHYRTVKAAPQLRFSEDNCHGQCEHCNSYLSGNITEYRINLVKKIGVERVEELERNNTIAKYTIEDAKRIKKEYKEKAKELGIEA